MQQLATAMAARVVQVVQAVQPPAEVQDVKIAVLPDVIRAVPQLVANVQVVRDHAVQTVLETVKDVQPPARMIVPVVQAVVMDHVVHVHIIAVVVRVVPVVAVVADVTVDVTAAAILHVPAVVREIVTGSVRAVTVAALVEDAMVHARLDVIHHAMRVCMPMFNPFLGEIYGQ